MESRIDGLHFVGDLEIPRGMVETMKTAARLLVEHLREADDGKSGHLSIVSAGVQVIGMNVELPEPLLHACTVISNWASNLEKKTKPKRVCASISSDGTVDVTLFAVDGKSSDPVEDERIAALKDEYDFLIQQGGQAKEKCKVLSDALENLPDDAPKKDRKAAEKAALKAVDDLDKVNKKIEAAEKALAEAEADAGGQE